MFLGGVRGVRRDVSRWVVPQGGGRREKKRAGTSLRPCGALLGPLNAGY